MIWSSVIYASISLVILITALIIIIIKQLEFSSSAVYYFLALVIAIIGWVLGDLMQVIFSHYDNPAVVINFSRFATIISMMAMIATVLFARVLTNLRMLGSPAVFVAFIIFGGVVSLTLGSSYVPVKLVNPNDASKFFYVTSADLIWTFLDAGLVLFAGVIFLRYLARQKSLVDEKYHRQINIMMIGVVIAFFVSALIYAARTLIPSTTVKLTMLHSELTTAALGAGIIGYALLLGGKEAMYYSSRIYSLHIFDDVGISLYAAVFQAKHEIKEHLIAGVATAITQFASELIGKDSFPREIDLDAYSLMLEKKDNFIFLITSEFPTSNLRQGLMNVVERFNKDMEVVEITNLVETYLAYSPQVLR